MNQTGSYVLVRAAGAPLEELCIGFTDPPLPSGMLSLGLLTFDSTTMRVRRQERRLTAACSSYGSGGGSDTVAVDIERQYRVAGPNVVVRRAITGGTFVDDTGAVTGRTLVLRTDGYDYVYERISPDQGVFFARSGDVDGWAIGSATSYGPSGTPWSASLEPSHGVTNERIYLFHPAGRPPVGVYELGYYTTAATYARISRDVVGGGQIFESTSGQLTVTESSPTRVAGTFAYVGVDGTGTTTPVSGSFVARCREACR